MKRASLLMVTLVWLGARQVCLCAENALPSGPVETNGLVPLILELPPPCFWEPWTPPPDLPGIERPRPVDEPRPPLLVPSGLKNIAPGAKLTCSDAKVDEVTLAKLVDGKKGSSDENVVFFRKGLQCMEMDLQGEYEIYAIAIWRDFCGWRAFRCVVVQVADDAGFTNNVRTLFNNDTTNSAGLGSGTDRQYFESEEGLLINAKGVKARYLRFFSNGSNTDRLNRYSEIEVYGRSAK